MWWWEQSWWDPAIFPGVMGGLSLGIGRLLVTLIGIVRQHSHLPRYRQLFLSQGIVMVLFGIIGGIFSWAFSGKSGDFIGGITALTLLSLFAEKLMEIQGQDNPAPAPGAVGVHG
jgi:ammonia channel protein AmtB